MPGPLVVPLITAGTSLAGQALGNASNANMNRKNRRFAEKMYTWQRNDALADWNMQNAYNHPSAQMARLREAGLNPNLVYDNGAQMASAQVRSSSPQSVQGRPAQWDTGAVLGAYFNTQVQQAQIDNLQKQSTVLDNEAFLKTAQALGIIAGIPKTEADTQMSKFQLDAQRQLQPLVQSKMEEEIKSIQQNTKSNFDANERAALQNVQSLKEGYERILNMRVQREGIQLDNINKQIQNWKNDQTKNDEVIKLKNERIEVQQRIDKYRADISNAYKDGQLKDFDINLRKLGLNPSDPTWQRILTQSLEQLLNR